MAKRDPTTFRSARWFLPDDMRTLSHRARDGKLATAILNTWRELNPCRSHFKMQVDVKPEILQAGGFPLELPAMALGEVFLKPRPCSSQRARMQAEESWVAASKQSRVADGSICFIDAIRELAAISAILPLSASLNAWKAAVPSSTSMLPLIIDSSSRRTD